jgi:hypothetical protein
MLLLSTYAYIGSLYALIHRTTNLQQHHKIIKYMLFRKNISQVNKADDMRAQRSVMYKHMSIYTTLSNCDAYKTPTCMLTFLLSFEAK